MASEILTGDARDRLPRLEASSAQCCVTSPPYFGLRDYGTDGQIGLEATPEEYVSNLVAILAEVRRILADDGTLWLNIGDSYAGYHGNARTGDGPAPSDKAGYRENQRTSTVAGALKQKDLIGIPWMLAFALRADGWYLRSEIIWAKPNPMPESVTDRPTSSHEKLFLLSKASRYLYAADAIREADSGHASGNGFADRQEHRISGGLAIGGTVEQWHPGGGRNRRNVWTIDEDELAQFLKWKAEQAGDRRNVWTLATRPYPDAHFATFPPDLVEPCILAGSRPGDTILDPFAGAGTTGVVAAWHGRSFLGVELNPEYAAMASRRIEAEGALGRPARRARPAASESLF